MWIKRYIKIIFKQFYCKILIQIPVLERWNEYYAKHWRKKERTCVKVRQVIFKLWFFFQMRMISLIWIFHFSYSFFFIFHSYMNIIYSYKIFNITIQECHKITCRHLCKRGNNWYYHWHETYFSWSWHSSI